jgi:hypothetical protein
MKNKFISFNRSSSCWLWSWNIILTFCGRSLIILICVYVLLRFLI